MSEHERHDTEGHSPYLAQHIREALATASTAELGVDVVVAGGCVYLTGTVATDEHRLEIGRVAEGGAEGLPVHNDVQVVHAGPDPEVEVLS